MHLLAAKPGLLLDGSEAVDLGQSPGDIVVLSAADSELACLSAAKSRLGVDGPSLRLANLLRLQHHLSVDNYVEQVVAKSRLVVVRLLGGHRYWPHGIDQISAVCREAGIALACLPGDDQPDPELDQYSTLPAPARHRLWRYLVEGGVENARHLLLYAASLVGRDIVWQEPRPLLRAGLYWPGLDTPSLDALRSTWEPDWPVAGIVFYRALVQAGHTQPIDAMSSALALAGSIRCRFGRPGGAYRS
jgi:cobaltochelatase CobN